MAKDIESIERSVATPTSNVSSGNAFDRLGQATSGLSQMITSKLNEVGVDMAAKQGQQDALTGEAPKSLAPGVNKTTRAYNNAVSDTEARHLVLGARQQIREAYVEATNPATFTNETPALFKAKMQGIVDGTLENTRPDNRSTVALALEQLSADASVNMLSHSIDYDNKQTMTTMSAEVDQLVKERRNASIVGDKGAVTAIDEQLGETLNDYAVQNQVINTMLPDLKKKLEQNAQVDSVLGDFAEAASQGKQAEFLSDLSQNKQNIEFDTWQKATQEVLSLDATEQKLNLQTRAFSNQSVINGIDNNTITTADQINETPNLTATDQLKLADRLEKHKQALAKSQYSLIDAQKNIVQGNPGFNSDKQKNAMFANARQAFEQQTGRPMNLVDMWESINGTGPMPASGIPGVSMGADVLQFNALLSNQLTSNNPEQVIQAASIFNDAKKKPNLINLSGQALAIATNFNTLNLGNVDPVELAKQVSKTTLDAKDPEIQTRSNRFKDLYGEKGDPDKLGSVFKQVFDTAYSPGVSDNAFGVFKETYREQFLLSDSQEAAINATKYLMRAWGASKYFEDGMVAQPVPEKELNITKIGYAFDNQLKITAQLLINKNKADPDSPFKIEWASKDQEIKLDRLTDEDRVFKNLGVNQLKQTPIDNLFPSSKPKVKINGRDTELFLMPTPESRLGERVQYALYYHDKFGMVQPVPDHSSPNGVAMFSPVGMDRWAPQIAKDETDTRIKDQATKFVKAQAMQDFEALEPQNVWQSLAQIESLILGSSTGQFMRGTPEQRAEIFRRVRSGNTAEIEKAIRQRIQGRDNSAAPAEASKADHVGIKAIQEES